jgi:nitrogen fixation/metabolism regulation signal transduction histidine kinase
MKFLIVAAASFGAILLFLLASASANTALFASNYAWLLGLNVIVALSLLALIAWQLRLLWGEHRAKVFGSRLKLRLMLMFGLMAVLPGVLDLRRVGTVRHQEHRNLVRCPRREGAGSRAESRP